MCEVAHTHTTRTGWRMDRNPSKWPLRRATIFPYVLAVASLASESPHKRGATISPPSSSLSHFQFGVAFTPSNSPATAANFHCREREKSRFSLAPLRQFLHRTQSIRMDCVRVFDPIHGRESRVCAPHIEFIITRTDMESVVRIHTDANREAACRMWFESKWSQRPVFVHFRAGYFPGVRARVHISLSCVRQIHTTSFHRFSLSACYRRDIISSFFLFILRRRRQRRRRGCRCGRALPNTVSLVLLIYSREHTCVWRRRCRAVVDSRRTLCIGFLLTSHSPNCCRNENSSVFLFSCISHSVRRINARLSTFSVHKRMKSSHQYIHIHWSCERVCVWVSECMRSMVSVNVFLVVGSALCDSKRYFRSAFSVSRMVRDVNKFVSISLGRRFFPFKFNYYIWLTRRVSGPPYFPCQPPEHSVWTKNNNNNQIGQTTTTASEQRKKKHANH